MSLPDSWVDRIFTKLTNVYGHQFLSRWDGLPIDEVKADWAHELRSLSQSPQAIAFGLENLPAGKAPTVLEFRAICTGPQAPRPERQIALPRVIERDTSPGSRQLERLRRVREEIPDCGRWAWAFALRLKDQEEPDSVTPTARAMYREAIANWDRRHVSAEAAE